ncbi:hypothetical protein OS493_021209 [Desmophyllum pertusum]|uniref:Hydroxylysine kinase n=1 Tax=Desmophyllum pertusum TaxID=174260 RepID=A0A9W9ZPQ1_9CNID|nr:hypothetical protein OS493_021209 [Desmophyllum pertusum]
MAAQLFNLNIADPSSVKELDSYDDRNFFMRGSLMGGKKEMGVSGCKEYVLKIANHMDSNHECLIEVQGDVMVFLQARDYNCSTPVPSIFKTTFVKCKIPTAAQPDGVSIVTESVALDTDNDALKTDSVALETDCVALETDSGSVVISNNRSFDTLGSVNNAGNLEDGIEIYDGKEYSEEEYFVCAVRLLTFVPGKMLNEIPLNTELLFNAGIAVGRLDRDLKDFECPRLDRPGFLWDLSGVGDSVEQLLEAVNDKRHKKMVREVCESFRKEVEPKLHLLPKQIIHGDASYGNIVVTPEKEIGFIDFGDLNYSCRIFELATSLMFILNVEDDLSCGRTRMAGYFFAGYHSVNPLSDEEMDLLHVLVASRFCQSLVFGAYTSKHNDNNGDPSNEYILETARMVGRILKHF